MDLRYPIGKFQYNEEEVINSRDKFINEIATLAEKLTAVLNNLTEEQLNTPYREGGWTIKQVVHHLADSHMNSFIRFKLALTENNPVIKPYDENLWAELSDSKIPINLSLDLINSLHQRWVILLNSMTATDYQKNLTHPEIGQLDLNKCLALYAWHGNHHTAHIAFLKERNGWKN